jgi:hypothetical protein
MFAQGRDMLDSTKPTPVTIPEPHTGVWPLSGLGLTARVRRRLGRLRAPLRRCWP